MHRSVLQALMNIAPAHITDPNTRSMLLAWQQEIRAMAEARGVASLLAQRDAYVGALVGKVLTDLTKTVEMYVAVYGETDEDAPAQEPVTEGTPAETS